MAQFIRVQGSSMLKRSQDPLHRKHLATFSVVEADSGQVYECADLEPGYGRLRMEAEPDRAEIEGLLALLRRYSRLCLARQIGQGGPRSAAEMLQEAAIAEKLAAIDVELRAVGWLGPTFETKL